MQIVGVHHASHGGNAFHPLLILESFQLVAWILYFPQTVVEAYLGLDGIMAAHPVEGLSLDFAISTGKSAACLWVVGTVDGGHATIGVLVAGVLLVALDDVGILQAHLLTGSQTHKLLLGHLHEVVALNPYLAAELHLMRTVSLVLRIIHGCKHLCLAFRIVGEDHLHRVEHGTDSKCTGVQVFAQ